MSVLTVLLISLGFILVNALFVAAEFALVGAPKATFENRAARGDRLARRIQTILESPALQDRYIATSQIGISAASVGLGMYGEHALAAVIRPHLGAIPVIGTDGLAVMLAIGGLTALHISFGETVPQTIALQRAELVARLAYWPMSIFRVLCYPFVWLLTRLATLCLKALGIRRQANVHEQVHTPEELQLIVEDSAEGGAIRSESGRILRELFEFGDLTAGQVMVPRVRVVGLPVGASSDEVRRLVTAKRHTRYPVFAGDLDHIIGMLHVKDVLKRLMTDERIGAADAKPMPVIPVTSSLDDVLATMQRAHAHMAIVIDEHGGTAGLVTLEDLFEEVVGELDDSTASVPRLAPEADGSVRAGGTVRLDELGQFFDLDLQHEEVDSVSGLVLARLGRPPVVGDVVDYGRLQLKVTATSGRGVREVHASLLPEDVRD